MINTNGKSYMDFDVKITKQGLDQVEQAQIEDVATWNVGAPGSIEMKMTSQALTEFSAVTIYRVVTVQVKLFHTILENRFKFQFLSHIHYIYLYKYLYSCFLATTIRF
jgi:hypothetical protein